MSANKTIRNGVVSSVSAEQCAVRVLCEDEDNQVTDWLPVVVPQTLKNKDYALPDVGENVVCLFLGNGMETGFCLGSIYSDDDKPPVKDANKRGTWFEDGSYVEFDRASGKLTIDAKGKVSIKAADGIQIDGDAKIKGDVNVTGNLTVDGSITRGGVAI
ncbi:phage baseplate assembly protein V [Paenibacillus azoreducens]|uniref:phage baseplate assembly protein V n=1 Tax=Paenibacillus azoreducens TaxID=116718 RepID=UPI0039F5E6C2